MGNLTNCYKLNKIQNDLFELIIELNNEKNSNIVENSIKLNYVFNSYISNIDNINYLNFFKLIIEICDFNLIEIYNNGFDFVISVTK
jgi:hypothetical protein